MNLIDPNQQEAAQRVAKEELYGSFNHRSFAFIFEDGSSGLWAFNERHGLDALPDRFVDSDDNDIPSSASAIPGMIAIFPRHDAPNVVRMGDRVGQFGFSVSGPGSGNGRCTFSCGEQSCTVTYRQN